MRLGTDLFSNWCDDEIVLTKEPQPVTEQTWPIVAGALRVTEDEAYADASVRAVDAVGLVAERPDGSTVDLGDLTVTNRCWGLRGRLSRAYARAPCASV